MATAAPRKSSPTRSRAGATTCSSSARCCPQNASRKGTIAACERSLKRLGTDRIDLYLLHWRGSVPLARHASTPSRRLRQDGKIRHWGVSNFDIDDMDELFALPGGRNCATNQVLYNLTRRGIEFDLLPWCQRTRPSRSWPIRRSSRAACSTTPRSKPLASRHGATPAQVALAWVLRQDGVIAIPKAVDAEACAREPSRALDLRLTGDDLAALDKAFPPPTRKRALEML